ncbi:hypothetical protein [Candidatus Uabimicrobium sp. HlEnr_7]|uniref:hypothetical protein n=1 Tax=Candidatus Uabimicrobium helgolandensis TaxID=3095367 RepID=UPI003558D5CB
MTWVSYPDIKKISENKRYLAEARSPDNKTINNQNNSPPNKNLFGYQYQLEQKCFR